MTNRYLNNAGPAAIHRRAIPNPAVTRILFIVALLFAGNAIAGIPAAPARAEGEGPFPRLIIRGGTLIDGTGAPAFGPVDIVIAGNRIQSITTVGNPGIAIRDDRRPIANPGDRELDAAGMYILPGFVDMHGHLGGEAQGTPAEYVLKLWLAHGITTIRDPGSENGLDWMLDHQRKSAGNRITAPRIKTYLTFGDGSAQPITSARAARDWVKQIAGRGADGIKFFNSPPEILQAALQEAKQQGLRTAMHHTQQGVARTTVLDTAAWGLTTMEHWYGLPEAMLANGHTVQDFPADYNYLDEYQRFREAGKLWAQAAEPGSAQWNRVRDTLLALDFTLDPTFTIYQASRDLMAQRRAEWHDEYTLPSLWEFFQPSRSAHGSYWFDWSTADEIAWKRNFTKWMAFVNDYKNHGGRVTVGSDAGYIYKVYGFGYIQELELLQEAGFHPLEVIRAATLHGAEAIGMANEIGSIEPGKLADLLLVPANPLQNLKVLYGTGAIHLNTDNQVVRLGGVRWVIKDGIIFDAPALLEDVRAIVQDARKAKGITELRQPGR